VTGLTLSEGILYASTDGKGVFKSTDFGANWVPVFPSSGSYPGLNTVAADPNNANIVFAGTVSGKVYRSTDGGATWEAFTCSPGYNRGIVQLAVHRQNSRTVYAGGYAGFAVSTDSGEHWTHSNSGLSGHYIRSLVADDRDPLTFYAGTRNDGLWKTTDGGASWSPITQNLPANDAHTLLQIPNSDVLFASMWGVGLYKSTDRGDTWVRVGEADFGIYVSGLAVSPDGSNLYALDRGFHVSTDQGVTWAKKGTGLPTSAGGFLAIDPVDSRIIYAGYYEKGLFKTTDGGETWTEIGNFQTVRIRTMLVDPWDENVVYVGTDGYLARSTDKGVTWSTSYLTGLHHGSIQVLAKGPAKTVLAGTWQGGIFASRDRGETWSEVKPRVPSGAPMLALAFAPGGTMLIGTLGAGVFTGEYGDTNQLYFPQVADGVSGSIKLRSTLVLVNGGDETQATIMFRNTLGQPMAIKLNDSPAQSTHTVNLKRFESVAFQTPGTGQPQVGYAIVTAGPQVTGNVVFSLYDGGVCMYESGVPATPTMYECSILFDTEEPGRNVGLALVSAADTGDARVIFRLYDASHNEVATKEITALDPEFGPGHHFARYATEIFPEITALGIRRGVVTAESAQPFAAVTLRQTDVPEQAFPLEVPTMCTFPVIDRRAAVDHRPVSVDYLYFPQIANGSHGAATYQTTVLLLNTGRKAETVKVEFFDSNGQPLAMPLKSLGERTVVQVSVEPGHTLELQTTGQGAVKVGYAKVRAPLDFGGTAVFTFWENGIRLFEAGVPAVLPSRRQCVFLDNLAPGRDIGFALINASSEASPVTFKLYDSTGQLRATRSVTEIIPSFGVGNHLAKYAGEIFPEIRQQNIKSGIIGIESQEQVAAVTLRQHSPSQAFPGDIYLLTIFPVVPLLP